MKKLNVTTGSTVAGTILRNAGICFVVWMAFWAVCFGGVASSSDARTVTANNVLATSHRLEVIGVDTRTRRAALSFDVIKLHAFRNRTNQDFVDSSMSFRRTAVYRGLTVPILISRSSPEPARLSFEDVFPHPLRERSRLLAKPMGCGRITPPGPHHFGQLLSKLDRMHSSLFYHGVMEVTP